MPTAIEQAIDEVLSGCEASIRSVARKWGVASSTLSDRVKGGIGRQEGHQKQQLLSTAQEEMLYQVDCGARASWTHPYTSEDTRIRNQNRRQFQRKPLRRRQLASTLLTSKSSQSD
jgi:transposase-like protein